MKKAMVVFLCICAVGGVFAQQRPFDWAIALAGSGGALELSADKTTAMTDGDVFSFLIKSGADCYLYVVAQTADNEVLVLYSGAVQRGVELTIGPMELTSPSGTEAFFVVASTAPQAQLARLADTYNKNPASARNGRAVLNEVFALRRTISGIHQPAEQPVFIGGAFRGEAISGLQFSGAETYVRTFNISH